MFADKDGIERDIVLGYDNTSFYRKSSPARRRTILTMVQPSIPDTQSTMPSPGHT